MGLGAGTLTASPQPAPRSAGSGWQPPAPRPSPSSPRRSPSAPTGSPACVSAIPRPRAVRHPAGGPAAPGRIHQPRPACASCRTPRRQPLHLASRPRQLRPAPTTPARTHRAHPAQQPLPRYPHRPPPRPIPHPCPRQTDPYRHRPPHRPRPPAPTALRAAARANHTALNNLTQQPASPPAAAVCDCGAEATGQKSRTSYRYFPRGWTVRSSVEFALHSDFSVDLKQQTVFRPR